MDLLEVLWMQDLDMGVSKEDFNFGFQVEQGNDFEVLKNTMQNNFSEDTFKTAEPERSKDGMNTPPANVITDGETGEIMIVEKQIPRMHYTGTENQTSYLNNVKDVNSKMLQMALNALEMDLDVSPLKAKNDTSSQVCQEDIPVMVDNISSRSTLSVSRQNSLEAMWSDVEGYINTDSQTMDTSIHNQPENIVVVDDNLSASSERYFEQKHNFEYTEGNLRYTSDLGTLDDGNKQDCNGNTPSELSTGLKGMMQEMCNNITEECGPEDIFTLITKGSNKPSPMNKNSVTGLNGLSVKAEFRDSNIMDINKAANNVDLQVNGQNSLTPVLHGTCLSHASEQQYHLSDQSNNINQPGERLSSYRRNNCLEIMPDLQPSNVNEEFNPTNIPYLHQQTTSNYTTSHWLDSNSSNCYIPQDVHPRQFNNNQQVYQSRCSSDMNNNQQVYQSRCSSDIGYSPVVNHVSQDGFGDFNMKRQMKRVDRSKCRDADKVKEMNIPLTIKEIIETSAEMFNTLLMTYHLTDAQVQLVKNIRRRGKNKVAAQNCRKRKFEMIETLEEAVIRMRKEKEDKNLMKHNLTNERDRMKEKCQRLYDKIFKTLRDEFGNPLDPDQYMLHDTPDGNVLVVPKLGRKRSYNNGSHFCNDLKSWKLQKKFHTVGLIS